MFKQNIVNGSQKESPDYWLEYGNPWEFKRHNTRYKVRFGGRIQQEGKKTRWIETEEILGVAYNQIIPLRYRRDQHVAFVECASQ